MSRSILSAVKPRSRISSTVRLVSSKFSRARPRSRHRRESVAELAAHQLVDRHAERLALEVPERDLDAGQRGDQRAGEAALEHEAAADVLEDHVDGEGVAADQPLLEIA
jgi:hypothetical protein